MRMLKSLAVVFGLGVLLVMASTARADQWDRLTKITFSGPVQVADTQLAAGTYVFKLMDDEGDRHIVQIFNADQTHLIATILAMPDFRMTPTSSTAVKFAESGNGSQAEGTLPESGMALKEWFYPGDSYGQEFKVKPVAQVAEAQPEPAPAPAPDAAPAAAATPEPAPVAAPALAQTSDSQTAAPAPAPSTDQTTSTNNQNSDPSELPKTASDMPLMGLVGLFSLGVAASLRIVLKMTA